MKMTAAILEECGKPLQLMDLEIPKLKRGQVLVKIAYSAICRSQLMEINGSRGHDRWLPHMLGHEASGIVVEVGGEVTKVKPEDEVILTWIKSSGIEADTPHFSCEGRTINAGPVTTFSNYSVVSENRLVLKPPGLNMDVAVLFGCALSTGAGMVLNELTLSKNDAVVVVGLGGVGMAALLALLAMGIENILAIERDPSKCALAKSFGVQVIQNDNDNTVQALVKQFFPNGADYCVEAGGSTKTIELGFATLNPRSGTLIFASHPPTGQNISLDPHQLICGKHIKGSWGGGIYPDKDIPILANLFSDRSISLSQLTNNTYELKDINKAIKSFQSGEIFRAILAMKHT
jgi:S-(hydroxymethyl)glutathione dehydrogenase / alcohol dehydrogenase